MNAKLPALLPAFVAASDVVDFHHPAVAALARSLQAGTPRATAQRCFEWVRDRIEHSIDYKRDRSWCGACVSWSRSRPIA